MLVVYVHRGGEVLFSIVSVNTESSPNPSIGCEEWE